MSVDYLQAFISKKISLVVMRNYVLIVCVEWYWAFLQISIWQARFRKYQVIDNSNMLGSGIQVWDYNYMRRL